MRLIDIDALPDGCAWCGDALIEAINDAPTIDAVEVVRCRDCKYAEENWNGKDIYCLRTSSFPWSNDSFCSDGEREDGDSDE